MMNNNLSAEGEDWEYGGLVDGDCSHGCGAFHLCESSKNALLALDILLMVVALNPPEELSRTTSVRSRQPNK